MLRNVKNISSSSLLRTIESILGHEKSSEINLYANQVSATSEISQGLFLFNES